MQVLATHPLTVNNTKYLDPYVPINNKHHYPHLPPPLRERGGDMSGFVRLSLMNFGPRGGAFEI